MRAFRKGPNSIEASLISYGEKDRMTLSGPLQSRAGVRSSPNGYFQKLGI